MSSRQLLLFNPINEPNNAAAWPEDWTIPEEFVSTAIIPLLVEERAIGVLVIDSRESRRFEEELRFMQLMANQAAMAIENARLQQEEMARQRLEEELALGRQIQLSMLPKSCPNPPGWQFCDIYQAARLVGGDFYDFFELPGEADRLGLVIGDVSDKGVAAALFMGISRTLIRSAAFGGLSPAETLQLANGLILDESHSGYFLSAFYGILDLGSGRLDFANAGHNPPLHHRPTTGEFRELSAQGIVMCVLDDITLEEKSIEVANGDFLIFYTDGVTEAMNESHEEFGSERLRAEVAANASGSATDVLHAIVDAVSKFTGAMDQSDDFTLYIVKRL